MNEFEAKWLSIMSQGHSAGRFRVYPDHILNFYVQYSLSGLREAVIEFYGANLPPLELPSLKNIELFKTKSGDLIRIGMTLQSGTLSKSFSIMCYDLAERSKEATSIESAVSILIRTLDNWAELFRKKAQDGLSRDESLGLLGEVLVLDSLLNDSSVDKTNLILGWRGQNGDTHDIGVNGLRVEIKAQRSTTALRLRVSSLTQLDDNDGHIFVVLIRLSPSSTGFTINRIIEEIQVKLSNHPLALLEFERKILLSGMSSESQYSQEPWLLEDRLVFSVTENFPKLTPKNVPLGIIAAQYEVAGPQLDACRTTWESLIGAIND